MQLPQEPVAMESGAVRSITVGDFMTRELVTVQELDDLALADQMLRLGGIRHLPVVRQGKLVGILTHRDLLRSAAERPAKTTRDTPERRAAANSSAQSVLAWRKNSNEYDRYSTVRRDFSAKPCGVK